MLRKETSRAFYACREEMQVSFQLVLLPNLPEMQSVCKHFGVQLKLCFG